MRREQDARLARDYFSYLHLPMITGIVLFALGLKSTIEHVGERLATIPAVALCGGLSLYFLTHVGVRLRLVHFIRRTTVERPAGSVTERPSTPRPSNSAGATS